MKKFLPVFLAFIFSFHGEILYAQQDEIKPYLLVSQNHFQNHSFQQKNLFTISESKFKFVSAVLKKHDRIQINKTTLKEIATGKSSLISFSIPFNNELLTLELVKVNLFSNDFKLVSKSSNETALGYKPGIYYRGIINGDENSIASFSFFDNEMIGIISSETLGNITIAPFKSAEEKTTDYIVFADRDFISTHSVACATVDNPAYAVELIKNINSGASLRTVNCVRVYYEVDFDIYKLCGSDVASTANWITAVHNNVATIYSNDEINTALSEVYVWDVDDPYKSTTASEELFSFKEIRPQLNGDIGQLISIEPGNLGGVASDINGLCNDAENYAYSDVDFDYEDVPAYSWTVGVITHEFGHLLGSFHTHNCTWPGGPIDDCGPLAGYPNEGDCGLGPDPVDGGTVMSYCHLTDFGINFSKGFGELPASAIRGAIDNSFCLSQDCAPIVPSYCSSEGNTASEWIQSVGFNSFYNYSGAGSGYSDFTNLNISMPSSGIVSFQLTPGYSGTKWSEYFNIWIDYNGDKDFFDKGENVFSSTGTNETITGSFTVPDNLEGISRIRISMMFDTLAGSCEVFKYGEVEDYSVDFTKSSYCESKGIDATNEWIDFFGYNTMENVSASDGGYHDFTALSSNVALGEEVSFAYSAGMSGPKQEEHWKMWIDFNQDDDFDDDGEMLFGRKSSKKGMLTRKITIPLTALTGTTRLRLAMKRDEKPGSCENFDYGEVEDYNINILTLSPGAAEINLSAQLFPNPAGEVLNIILSNENAITTLQIITAEGRLIQAVTYANSKLIQLNTSTLTEGIYFIRIISNNHPVIVKKFVKGKTD